MLRDRFEQFRDQKLNRVKVNLRRRRVEQLQAYLRDVDGVEACDFDCEVWRVEACTWIGADRIKVTRMHWFKSADNDAAFVDRVQEALDADQLSMRGNYLWSAGTQVYAACLVSKNADRTGHIHEALHILNGDATPLDKCTTIADTVYGFGTATASGLVMVCHPDQFATCNGLSRPAVASLGFPDWPVEAFQATVAEIRDVVGADDYLELDSFFYCMKVERA